MIANNKHSYLSRPGGFSVLELVVAVAVITLVAVVAFHQFYKLLVDVERSRLELDLTTFQSVLSLQVADYYAKGRLADLETLVDSNPIDLLAEKPENYLGVIREGDLNHAKKGSWFYDDRSHVLVYLVKNSFYFETLLDSPTQIRFRVEPVYSDTSLKQGRRYLTGLVLQAQEPYLWRSPWE